MQQPNKSDWTIPKRYIEIKEKNTDSHRNIRVWSSDSPEEDSDWDAFLSQTKGSRFEQTSLWAQVKKVDGWQPLRLIFTIEQEIIAGFQILMKKKPLVGYIGYVSKGPVVKNEDTGILKLVVSQLKKITKKTGIKILIVQPPDYGRVIFNYLDRNGFMPNNIAKTVYATARLDLRSDQEKLFESMSPSTKRNIRLGIRKGVTVRQGSVADIAVFFNLMKQSCMRQNVLPSPSSVTFFKSLWNTFNPKKHLILLISEYEKEIVSGIIAIGFNKTVYIYKIGWSGRFGKFRPNDVAHWELIRFAKASGYSYLDFVGIEPEVAEAVSQGGSFPGKYKQTVSSFKLGFGGEALLLCNSSVYIYNPLLKTAYKNIFPGIKSIPAVQRIIHSV